MGRKRLPAVEKDKTSNGYSQPASTGEKFHLHVELSNAKEAMNAESGVQQASDGILLKKNSNVAETVVRRSERLKGLLSLLKSPGAKPVVDHVDLVENEKEELLHSQQFYPLPEHLERAPPVDQVSHPPEVNKRSLVEKVDYLVSVADELKTKVASDSCMYIHEFLLSTLKNLVFFKYFKQVSGRPYENTSPDFGYKSLYFESQKKIEALIEENYKLVRRLEFANGKITAYEAMKDAMGAPKGVILVPTVGKATEATASLSLPQVQNCTSPPAVAAAAEDDSKPKRKYDKPKRKCQKKKPKHVASCRTRNTCP